MPTTIEYHRRCERTQVEMTVTLLVPGTGPNDSAHRAVTADLSTFGARVISDLPLVAGQKVRFIPRDADQPSLAVPGRIVWVGECNSDRAGQAGIEFLIPLGW